MYRPAGSHLGATLPPEDTGHCLETFGRHKRGLLLAGRGWRPEMLLNLHGTQHSPQVTSTKSAESENLQYRPSVRVFSQI